MFKRLPDDLITLILEDDIFLIDDLKRFACISKKFNKYSTQEIKKRVQIINKIEVTEQIDKIVLNEDISKIIETCTHDTNMYTVRNMRTIIESAVIFNKLNIIIFMLDNVISPYRYSYVLNVSKKIAKLINNEKIIKYIHTIQ
jgi:flagellar biosynthesis protein FlhB